MRIAKAREGKLIVLGTGIKAVCHLTVEAQSHIDRADKVCYLVADPITEKWIRQRNRSAESLYRYYGVRKDRNQTYLQMVSRILTFVRRGLSVCAVFYGHPGVFAFPSHEAIRRARAEGFEATMLPAVSAEDCLFADLGIDPGMHGCQSFEATDFILHGRKFDSTSHLVLWQIAVISEQKLPKRMCNIDGLKLLKKALIKHYPKNHRIYLYEASQFVICKSKTQGIVLKDLQKAAATPISTLYVPPLRQRRPTSRILKALYRVATQNGRLARRFG